ncbi:hypothetical protein PAE9249_03696 [Paenibacillus sp. CECT 9249]|nr:hypothetical protein [Paenibacillus sp. CECT 9249]CAH0121170.1 hypothetical protein PAE9249_03696 [Paenibacillus sp. CECT 9249]
MRKGKQIAFWSPACGQTGTSTNLAAAAAVIGLDYYMKTLVAYTKPGSALEPSLVRKPDELAAPAFDNTGLDALKRLARSNRLTANIVKDYTRPILKDRLDFLPGPTDFNEQEDKAGAGELVQHIFACAGQFYDTVLVEVGSGTSDELTNAILEASDVIVVNLNQNAALLDRWLGRGGSFDTLRGKTCVYLLGRYDRQSRYKAGNIARKYHCKTLFTVPYSAGLMDACNDHAVIEFFMRNRNVRQGHDHYHVVHEVRRLAKTILEQADVDSLAFRERGA